MSIGDRILAARNAKGLSRAELSKRTGGSISPFTIRDWESGKYQPNVDKIYELMVALDVDANYLLQDSISVSGGPSMSEDRRNRKIRRLEPWEVELVDGFIDLILEKHLDRELEETAPTYPRVMIPTFLANPLSAGKGIEQVADDEVEYINYRETPASKRADLVLRVKGDSMEPSYSNGDLVLVKRQATIEPGEIGAFLMDDQAFIKQWEPGILRSLNPAYRDIVLDKECTLIGRVLGKAEI